MQRFAVIGYPLGHSLSPAIHNAAFEALGMDASYEARPVQEAGLAGVIAELRTSLLAGVNVTVPHKERVIELLDGLDAGARAIGAVNCIVREDSKLTGYNTDKYGFIQSLLAAGFEPQGKKALVLGAGGSARAVALGLAEAGAEAVLVAGRDLSRAQRLVADLDAAGGRMRALGWQDERLAAEARQTDLIVNCTPVGMSSGSQPARSPLPPDCFSESVCVSDLVYNPRLTPLLRDANAAGARTIGGLAMLVLQAAESFRLWTGREPPLDAMQKAAEEALT